MKAIIGRKMGMTEVFAEDGTMYPVTVIEVLPNIVTQVKTKETDGYDAIQVGYEELKESKANRPEKGIAKKANTVPHEALKELKGDEMMHYQLGDAITCDIFKAGEVVDVIGTSKGKGYSGVIKRWHQKIGPKGHGSGYHRGQGTFANNGRTNNRVLPGKHMSGHAGHQSATVLNQQIIAVYPDKNCILVKGGVPGPKKSLVTIRTAVKTQKNVKAIKTLIDRSEKPVVEETPLEEEVITETPVVEEEVVSETPVVETPVEEAAPVEETPVEAPVEETPVETPVEAPVEEAPVTETTEPETSEDEETPHEVEFKVE